MEYKVILTKQAIKDLEDIAEPYYSNIKKAILSLAENPRPAGCKKLIGTKTAYRVRVSNYRIIYDIYDESLVVDVIKIGHRKDVYK